MIQRACLEYLNHLPNCYAFRSSAGVIKTQNGNFFKTGRPGLPDICATFSGKSVYFEVKTEKGKQSFPQKQAEKSIKAAGGYYFIVRSVRELKDAIKTISKNSAQ